MSQLNALTFAIDCIVTGFAFVFKLLYVEDAFRACALALLASLRPNFGTLVRALSTLPPVACANSARLSTACLTAVLQSKAPVLTLPHAASSVRSNAPVTVFAVVAVRFCHVPQVENIPIAAPYGGCMRMRTRRASAG